MTESVAVTVQVNGETFSRECEPRMTLADFLRDKLGLTGTHLGCEHGVCGACTVLMDGRTIRSCLTFAVQAHDSTIVTVEGLAGDDLHPIQEAFSQAHALQCGFCTPGFLIAVKEFLEENTSPSDSEIRMRLSGNLCRCTGYQNIIAAVQIAGERMRADRSHSGELG